MLKKIFTGNAFLLGDHVNTDILHPPDYFSLKKERIASGLSKGAEDFFSRMAKDDIIVAGRNFGCGSSRESSARSFAYNGIAVIVAESFARIFFRNLTNQGIYLITCPGIAKKLSRVSRWLSTLKSLKYEASVRAGRFPAAPCRNILRACWKKAGC